jgi:intracellular sulfur oxidation DsrE/DsrF family protein
MQRIYTKLALIGLAMGLSSGAAMAQEAKPVIPGYGALIPAEDTHNLLDPSLRYRVAFEVTRSADEPGKVNPALDRVARFVNLLGASGIRPAKGDVVVVIHGAATPSILNDVAYRAKFGRENPNSQLVRALLDAGVAVHVCNYALANQKIAHDAVFLGVEIDLAAMVTLTTLQLRGWALLAG